MAELTETEARPTRAYVIHPDLASRTQRREPEHALAEAVALAHALPGIEIVGDEVARLRKPDAGRLFGKGKLAEIGERLHLSQGTVRNYLSEAIGKLDSSNRIEAYRRARQNGWL